MKLSRLLIALCLTLTASIAASAQNSRGVIRGRVADSSERPVAGAKLTLIREETNEQRSATSNHAGDYAFTLLAPGNYRIELEQTGFKKAIAKVLLAVNQDARVDLSLAVGTLRDEIVIDASRAALKKDSAAQGAVVENSQVSGLPLDGRNFLELGLLVPGAAPAAQGSAGTVRGDFAFSVNGGREDANAYLLDGVYNIDPKLNGIGVKPPVDAVREFEVLSSTYDASFGRNSGAQVNVVLKSGGNAFHGTVYEFLRNRSLDARNHFAPSGTDAPQYQRNQFGFSIGGPVIKDRTFFFGDYEGTRLREGLTRVTNVPTLLERRGDFSQSFFPKPVVPGSGNRFPGDMIPGFFQNPVGVKIAALYPLPNRNVPFENYVSSPARRDRDDLFDVRLDHSLSKASQIAGRYSFDDRDLFEPFSGATFAAIPGFGTQVFRRAQNLMLGETHTFSPTLLNDLRFSYSRVAIAVNQENQTRNLNAEVGLPVTSPLARDLGLSFTTIPGFSPIGDEYNNPQFGATNIFQILDTATYARGMHLFKFGFEIRAMQQNAFRDVQSRGFIAFSPQAYTGNALADMLLGLPVTTGVAKMDNPQHLRGETFAGFATDSFRIRPNVTLTFGLRYEFNSPPVDVEDRARVFDITSRTLVQVGTNGVPRAGYTSDKNNFAPRLGLAWTIGSRGNTVLRTGYGVYYDQSSLAPGEGLYFNAPYFNLRFYFPYPPFVSLSLSNPFPSDFPFPTPPSAFAFQRDLRTPYSQHWSLSLQQQLGNSLVGELAYVGSKGTKLLAGRDLNEPHPSTQQPNPRPLPQFSDILHQESSASSTYHSFQGRLQQRLNFGLSLLASYTWSKSIDNASSFFNSTGDPNFPQNSYNVAAERGRSNFDVGHRFSASYSYDLPFGKGKAWLDEGGVVNAIVGGWQTLGVISLQTGRPFTVAILGEIDQSNTGRANLGFGNNDRPNLIGDPYLSNGSSSRWFNTSAFQFQPFGSYGSSGRNILDGPGYQNINLSLVKNTALKETLNLQFRTEFFNLFNHTNFDLPDNFLGSPTFGRIQSAQSPRRIQFGLKLVF